MAYTKEVWTEGVPITHTRLNNLETQYDAAVAEGVILRADNTKELRLQVVTSLPAAGTVGKLVFNSTNNTVYMDDGVNWRAITGSTVKKVERFSITGLGFGGEWDLTLAAAVDLNASVISILHDGNATDTGLSNNNTFEAWFLNSTTVRVQRHGVSGGNRVEVQVIQFEPGMVKSLQSASNVQLDTAEKDITINAVNLDKAIVYISCRQSFSDRWVQAVAYLSSATNLKVLAAVRNTSAYFSYFVVEFY